MLENKKFFIQTHGCQMNEYDSEKLGDVLQYNLKMMETKNPEDADVLLLNTCSIREKAQEKVFHQLGRWKKLKTKKPDLLIAVGGCVASQEGKNIRARSPEVDIVFGPQTIHRLPKMIENIVYKRKKIEIDINFPEIEKFDYLPFSKKKTPSAFLSIMEGCSKYCTFCVVPYTRGEEVNRRFDDILHEVNSLVKLGTKEIILLGQNVNAYKSLNNKQQHMSFSDLIRYISHIKGVQRIRHSTSHPIDFTDDLIREYNNIKMWAEVKLMISNNTWTNSEKKILEKSIGSDHLNKIDDIIKVSNKAGLNPMNEINKKWDSIKNSSLTKSKKEKLITELEILSKELIILCKHKQEVLIESLSKISNDLDINKTIHINL